MLTIKEHLFIALFVGSFFLMAMEITRNIGLFGFGVSIGIIVYNLLI